MAKQSLFRIESSEPQTNHNTFLRGNGLLLGDPSFIEENFHLKLLKFHSLSPVRMAFFHAPAKILSLSLSFQIEKVIIYSKTLLLWTSLWHSMKQGLLQVKCV